MTVTTTAAKIVPTLQRSSNAMRLWKHLPIRQTALLPTKSLSNGSPTRMSTSFFSTQPAPGELVSGLTVDDIKSNPQMAEFLKANFSENDNDNKNTNDGVNVTPEMLKEYGFLGSDFDTEEDGDGSRSYGDVREDLGLGLTLEQQSLNIRRMSTYLRSTNVQGSRACRELRETENFIPGMLYGSNPSEGILSIDKSTRIMIQTPWKELQRELARYHRKIESRVYDLTIYQDESDTEGTVHRVLPRDIQRHPVQGKVYCANFLRYHPGRPIKIPIVYINQEESNALKRDGFIIPVNKYVECIVEDGVPIPEALELECTGLRLKQVVRMDRLIFPEGVRHSKRVNPETFIIGPVVGGRGGGGASADEDA